MVKKILIMKTGSTLPSLLAKNEDFEDWFINGSGQEASKFTVCSIHLQEQLPALREISAIIITGSPAYLTDLEPWNETGADYIRMAHASDIPMLGVCYGHQLIAWAFGGKVGFHPQGREIGTVAIRKTADSDSDRLFRQLPREFCAQASHLQSVIDLPVEAVLLAANDFDPNHAFRLGKSTWSVQFHPEFTAAVTAAYIEERSVQIRSEGLDPEALQQNLQATPESAGLLKQFVELVSV